jgi:nucleoside-diphosphate-sugar epimerase
MEGHTMPGSGELYTNMIHRDDVAGAIDYSLRHDFDGIYNLSDDDHMLRKELYESVAQKHKLPKVQWDPSHPGLRSDNKRVSNHKIKGEGFTFHHPHRLLD